MPRRIVISGYYGFGSIGDEAILMAIIESLKDALGDPEISVLSASPSRTTADFGVKAIDRNDLFQIFKLLKGTDLFISGGGGLFQDIFRLNSVIYYGGLILLARLLGSKVMIYAQGVGPLKGSIARRLTRLAFNSADVITVRDDESQLLLAKIGVKKDVKVLADPVLGLDFHKDMSRSFSSKKPLIGIAPRDWPGTDGLRFARFADGLIAELGVAVLFIPMKYPEDLIFAKKISHLMKERANIFESSNPAHTFDAISGLDFLVSIPLHAAVMAAKAAVPFLSINYDPKVSNFLKLIGHEPAMDLATFAAHDLNEEVRLGLGRKKYLPIASNLLDGLGLKAKEAADHAEKLLYSAEVLGLKLDSLDLKESLDAASKLMDDGGSHMLVTLNTEMAVIAQKDAKLQEIINRASLVLPDSFGIKWAAGLKDKVTGVELVEALCGLAQKVGHKVAFFGGEEGVAKTAAEKLVEKYPSLKVWATYKGFLSEDEEKEMLSTLKTDPPDILFVGLGIPRQEKWIASNIENLRIPLALGVGGSFDVISGKVKRAPVLFQRMNLEWLYRLLTQPKRRFKRVITSLPKFALLVLKERRA